jgi:predicted AlkP superfamily phosphohydrolase/phosphomutase
MPGPRAIVLGLDSIPPELLFDKFLGVMPNMRALVERGRRGVLRTIDPPITVPAWAVMFTGVDPGTLGIYGFRHRRPGTYWDMYTPTPQMIAYPTVWDLLSRQGKRVCVIGMPPGYPPPAVNGVYISDFLTPSNAQDFIRPVELKKEILGVAGSYEFDVTFRAEDRSRVGEELITMTRHRWAVARHLWNKEPWDFFALHEIGPDRLHHTFWKYFDTKHPRYEENAPYRELADRYYRALDEEIGKFLAAVPPEVRILIASDHGSQAMDGCFCINEWLVDEGYLVLKSPATPAVVPLEKLAVDWGKTRMWGAGGYYARIFFNIAGREKEGIVPKAAVPGLIAELKEKLSRVHRPDGKSLDAQVYTPADLYRSVRGDAPDLIAYFGHLKWRSAGTLGHKKWFLEENDTGPDDSVHSFEGLYLLLDGKDGKGELGSQESILDVAPTLLTWFGLPVQPHMQGKPITAWDHRASGAAPA